MRNVKLILQESVPSLGEAGELVSVSTGYARNYLIPRGKAIVATESNVKRLEHQKRVVAERVAKELKELGALRDRLQQLMLEVTAQAGEEGKLFGSVTAANVAELIVAQGFEIDRRRIDLAEPIKTLGEHRVSVKLHREVVALVRVRVTAAE
jgi:large subunit ribosomal protein L9